MIRMEMRINDRRITSAGELERELTQSLKNHVETTLKKAAGPGVRLSKTRDGYMAQGTPEQIERFRRRLRRGTSSRTTA